jgi:GT2 family glycosyltransferase
MNAGETRPEATVVISTRNRREEVARAVRSALAQTADVEVLVTDDASSDGTHPALVAEFGDAIRLERSEERHGSLVHRTAAARRAGADVLISIDDDSELPSPDTVAQVLAEFDHPRIAAVTIPFREPRRSQGVVQRSLEPHRRLIVPAYLGCAAAIRRDVFLAAGGYRAELFHSGEEIDFCARILRSGHVVRLGSSDPAIHHASPLRSRSFAAEWATRNQLLDAYWHAPRLRRAIAFQLAVAAGRAVRRREPRGVLRGIRSARRAALAGPHERTPMPRELDRLRRRLWRDPRDLEELEPMLPRLTEPAL